MIENWRELPLCKVDPEKIEQFCLDWLRKLTNVQRSMEESDIKGPKTFVKFILD